MVLNAHCSQGGFFGWWQGRGWGRCAGSLLLNVGFLYLWRAGTAPQFRWEGFSWQWLLSLRSADSGVRGLSIVALRLSCSLARGILLDQGLNLHPLNWQADS